jgi:hypothetical protein
MKKKLLVRKCALSSVSKKFDVKPEINLEFLAMTAYQECNYIPITDEIDAESEYYFMVLESNPDQEKRAIIIDLLEKLSTEASAVFSCITNTPGELLEAMNGRNLSPASFKSKIVDYLGDKGFCYENIYNAFEEIKELKIILEG